MNFAKAAALTWLATVVAVSCSRTAEGPAANAQVGGESNAGAAGDSTEMTASMGGAGSDNDGSHPPVDYCGPLPLAEWCDARPASCPSLDDLERGERCRGGVVTIQETSCDGTVVVAKHDFGTDTWGFDETDVLTYKRVDSDQFAECSEGKGASASTVWGEVPCAVTGSAMELCGAGGSGAGGAGRQPAGGGGAGGAP